MNIRQDVQLKDYSTMRLGGPAAFLTEVHDADELSEAVAWATEQSLPILVIGGGSNIIWRDEGFNGLVIVNKLLGYDVHDEGDSVLLTVGAGEDWDKVVARSVEAGLTGIESLSLIPGSCGATPVQNVGAYGQEIAQTLVSLEAYDQQNGEIVTIAGEDCGFGYRTSRFKTTDRERFFITSLTFRLRRGNPEPPFYPALATYLSERSITAPTPTQVRTAVIAIRQAKLPDPAVIANNGSFFANPVINKQHLADIQRGSDVEVPNWPTSEDLVKLPAAWLVEQAGFKDFHDPETGMATWSKQPLVLVNESATSSAQLLAFRQKITDAVQAKFDIILEQEPELLPLNVAR